MVFCADRHRIVRIEHCCGSRPCILYILPSVDAILGVHRRSAVCLQRSAKSPSRPAAAFRLICAAVARVVRRDRNAVDYRRHQFCQRGVLSRLVGPATRVWQLFHHRCRTAGLAQSPCPVEAGARADRVDKRIEAWCDLVEKWKPLFWAEERGQIISGIGPYLQRRAIERKAYTHREQFVSRSDKATRAQSFRGRMAMLGLYVPTRAPWYPDLRSELLSFPAGTYWCRYRSTLLRRADPQIERDTPLPVLGHNGSPKSRCERETYFQSLELLPILHRFTQGIVEHPWSVTMRGLRAALTPVRTWAFA